MYKVNGKTLPLDRPFTLGDIQYPRNWLRLATEADKAALGITWEADEVRADDRYFWNGDITNPKALEDKEEVDEDGNPLFVKVLDNSDPENPVMVDSTERLITKGLKSNMISQVKSTAGSMLAQTDWMVIRKAERSVEIADSVATMRSNILTEAARLETAITACSDVEALIDVMNTQEWSDK